MRGFSWKSIALSGCVIVGGSAALVADSAQAATFNDSANVNVMRRYNPGGSFAVPHTTTPNNPGGGNDTNVDRDDGVGGANDGSGWNVETNGAFNTSSDQVQQTFNLNRTSLVGSFRVEFDGGGRAPASFKVEGSLDGVSFYEFGSAGASTYASPGSVLTANFATPLATNYIRYTATGPPAGAPGETRFGLDEFQVFLTTGQTIQEDAGYNYLHDKKTAGQVTEYNSPTSGRWVSPSGGTNASAADNGVYIDQVKSQVPNPNPTNLRTYIGYQLDVPTGTFMANMGNPKGESLGSWELYSTNDDSLWTTINGLPDNTIAAITAAGWHLQWDQGAPTGVPGFSFKLKEPGDWKNFLFVWNPQQNSLDELELINVPEPTGLSLVAIGASLLGMRRKRNAN